MSTVFGSLTSLGVQKYATINSPQLTGIPTAPTAATGTNTTQVATTAFVQTKASTGKAIAMAMVFGG